MSVADDTRNAGQEQHSPGRRAPNQPVGREGPAPSSPTESAHSEAERDTSVGLFMGPHPFDQGSWVKARPCVGAPGRAAFAKPQIIGGS
jgi:hypothetical protein